jgi:hypothetical protein
VLTPQAVSALVLSLTLGVLSHIVWDGFTHANRFGTDLIPALGRPWFTVAGYTFHGFAVAQYGSSLVGLPLIALVLIRLYLQQPRDDDPGLAAAPPALRASGLALAGAILIAASIVALDRASETPGRFWHTLAYEGATLTMAAALLLLLLMAIGQWLLGRSLPQRLHSHD